MKSPKTRTKAYGCRDYRQEMMLVGLCRRLNDPHLGQEERRTLQAAIRELEDVLYGEAPPARSRQA